MKELKPHEVEIVSGGLRWQDRPGSMNIVDMRTGYAHTPFLSSNFYIPNPIENWKATGNILPNRWGDLFIGRR